MDTIASKLVGQRVMLVGGAGFIGHNLAIGLRKLGIDTLVADNLMVNNLVDLTYGTTGGKELEPLRHALYLDFINQRFELMRDAGVIFRNVDARNFLDLSKCFDEFQPTTIIHLSAIASAVEAKKDPGLAFDLQLVTLRNILELCRKADDRSTQVITMSSSTIYGDFETDIVDESTRPRPVGIYANTKYMAERLIRTYNYQHGIAACIIRPSALYGERCISGRVSQAFIENALFGKPLLLEGGGGGMLDFTSIENLVEGIIRAIAISEKGGSTTYNLTFGNARSIAELAAIVKDVVPSAVLEERPRAKDKPIRGTLSTVRAEDELGFKADLPLEVGYRRYCEWYVENFERVKSKIGA